MMFSLKNNALLTVTALFIYFTACAETTMTIVDHSYPETYSCNSDTKNESSTQMYEGSCNTSNSKESYTTETPTATYDFVLERYNDRDVYTTCITDKETGDYSYSETTLCHDNSSPKDNYNNLDQTTTQEHDHLSDLAHRSRLENQEFSPDDTTERNYNLPNNKKIIRELDLPPGTILYLRDMEGRILDSTLILEQVTTARELEAALASPTVQAGFKRTKNGMFIKSNPHHTERHKTELQVLDALISGQVTQLIHKLQDPDLTVAESAFVDLKALWPWKRDHTFLAPDIKKGTGEPGFTNACLNINIMEIAEKSLLSRTDYLAKHADAQQLQKIQNYKNQCITLQEKGDAHSLLKEKNRLYLSMAQDGNNKDIVAQACFTIAEKGWRAPITKKIHTIIHAPYLEKARQELISLENEIITQAKQKNFTYTKQTAEYLINEHGFNILQAAHNAYRSRADYVDIPANQSVLSDQLPLIMKIIKTSPLPIAHNELVLFEKKVTERLMANNITDPAMQKEFLTQKFGRDIVKEAHGVFIARLDYKKLMANFTIINVEGATVKILETSDTYAKAADKMATLTDEVLNNARLCNLPFVEDVEPDILASIHVMRTTQEPLTFIYNATVVDTILTDIQSNAQAIVAGEPVVAEQTQPLFIRAVEKFISGLNPITQAVNMAEGFVVIGKAIYHPIITSQTVAIGVDKIADYLVKNACFTVDTTIGRYYLSEVERQHRIDGHIKAIAESPLTQLTAENWVDLIAQLTADFVFFGGVGRVCTYLKEIDAIGKVTEQAREVTNVLKKGIETHLADHPILVTAEGIAIEITEGMKTVKDTAKEIIRDSGKLIEAVSNGTIDTAVFRNLRSIGNNVWQSPRGLIYGYDRKFGNTFNHTLAHMTPNPLKKIHTVFNVPKDKLVQLIDEAWMIKGNPVPSDPVAYIVDMKRCIGTKGETAIRIVVTEPGTCEILTAYPIVI